MKYKPTAGIIAITLGLLVALIPILIFPVCKNMIELINGKTLFMKCHWTARAELVVGILMIFDGILTIGFKKHETRIALSLMLFILGLAAMLIPTVVIGMCETATMACRIGTKPALIVVSLITMIVGTGNVFSLIRSIKTEALNQERSVIK